MAVSVPLEASVCQRLWVGDDDGPTCNSQYRQFTKEVLNQERSRRVLKELHSQQDDVESLLSELDASLALSRQVSRCLACEKASFHPASLNPR